MTSFKINTIDNFFYYLSHNRTKFFYSKVMNGLFKKDNYKNKYIYRGIIISEKEYNELIKNKKLHNRYKRKYSAWTLNDLTRNNEKELKKEFINLYKYCRPSLKTKQKYLIILKKNLYPKNIKLDINVFYNYLNNKYDLDEEYKKQGKNFIEEENEVIIKTQIYSKDIIRVIKI